MPVVENQIKAQKSWIKLQIDDLIFREVPVNVCS